MVYNLINMIPPPQKGKGTRKDVESKRYASGMIEAVLEGKNQMLTGPRWSNGMGLVISLPPLLQPVIGPSLAGGRDQEYTRIIRSCS